MDTRDGTVFDTEDFAKIRKALEDVEFEKHFVPIPKARPGQVRAKKVGHNGPCPCGSGKKFKACCLGRAASSSERKELAEALRAARHRLDAEELP